MSLIPTNQQLREAHADPAIAEAREIVAELARQGLTNSEICRLASLPGRSDTIRRLREGTLQTMRPGILEGLKQGYARFDAGDVSYRRRRSTRREEPVRATSDATPMPLMLDPRSRLVERLVQKRKDRAAA
jgi:hypothetical protein